MKWGKGKEDSYTLDLKPGMMYELKKHTHACAHTTHMPAPLLMTKLQLFFFLQAGRRDKQGYAGELPHVLTRLPW